jgi:hypothetical protein
MVVDQLAGNLRVADTGTRLIACRLDHRLELGVRIDDVLGQRDRRLFRIASIEQAHGDAKCARRLRTIGDLTDLRSPALRRLIVQFEGPLVRRGATRERVVENEDDVDIVAAEACSR